MDKAVLWCFWAQRSRSGSAWKNESYWDTSKWNNIFVLHLPDIIHRLLRFGYVFISDVMVSPMASQITGLTIVYSTVYSGADQRENQRPASLAFLGGIHRWPVNSPHKGPVTRKVFSFDDVIIIGSDGIIQNALYLIKRLWLNEHWVWDMDNSFNPHQM